MIGRQNRLLDAFAEQLRAGAEIVHTKDSRARLREMAEFYAAIREAMDDALARWKRKREPR